MKNQRPLIRRTFLQERFDILIKKQRNGHATFNDLTELDEIVNRDPAIRESILEKMHEISHPPRDEDPKDIIQEMPIVKHSSVTDQIKEFFGRLFITEIIPAL